MSSLALFHTLSLLYLSKRTATVFIYPAASAAFTVAETLSFNQFSLVYPHIFNLHLYGSGHARRECSVYRAFSLPRPRKAYKSEVLVWCDRGIVSNRIIIGFEILFKTIFCFDWSFYSTFFARAALALCYSLINLLSDNNIYIYIFPKSQLFYTCSSTGYNCFHLTVLVSNFSHNLSLLYLLKRTTTVFIYPAASAAFTVAETLPFNQFSLVYPHIINLHLYGSGHARRECSVYRAFSLPRPRKACKSEVLVWCDRAEYAGDGGDAIETGDFVFVCVVSLVPCC